MIAKKLSSRIGTESAVASALTTGGKRHGASSESKSPDTAPTRNKISEMVKNRTGEDEPADSGALSRTGTGEDEPGGDDPSAKTATGAKKPGRLAGTRKKASAERNISEEGATARTATGAKKPRRVAAAAKKPIGESRAAIRKTDSTKRKTDDESTAAKAETGKDEPGEAGAVVETTAEQPPKPKMVRRRTVRRKLSTRARVGLMATKLLPEVEAAVEETSRNNTTWTRSRVDKVIQLGRLLEKLGEFSRSAEEKQKIAKDRENEIAGALEAIDRRIVELALGLAARIKSDG